MKVADAVWQLERNMDAQVITVINRDPVVAAAPLPELKLVYYVRQHVSDSLKEIEGRHAVAGSGCSLQFVNPRALVSTCNNTSLLHVAGSRTSLARNASDWAGISPSCYCLLSRADCPVVIQLLSQVVNTLTV